MNPMRSSPVHYRISSLGDWQDLNQMPTLWQTPNDTQHLMEIGIADVSYLSRWGIKGSHAASWLEQQGIPIPASFNMWASLPGGGLIARLGRSEFLIEDSAISAIAPRLAAQCQPPVPGIYPVLRQDLALVLAGHRIYDLLCQTCNVNFLALDLTQHPVLLTLMVGVSVTIIPGDRQGLPYYRLWCDSTFGIYLWDTLVTLAQEWGGGIVGSGCFTSKSSE